MKILQITPHYVPAYHFGGPLRVAHSLGKSLVTLGHQVTVCTTNLKDEFSFLDVSINKPVDIDGVTVFYEKVNSLRWWGYSRDFKTRITNEIKDSDIVITHFHYQYASYIGGLLARKNNKPLIVFSHGSLNKNGVLRKKTILKFFYINIFEKKNFNNAAFIAFNCEEERQLSYFRKNGKVIPNGIDLNDFKELPLQTLVEKKYPQSMNKKIFLFLGRLNYKQKGLDILIPAFHNAISENPDIHLIIAGPDELGGESKLRKSISELKLDKHITITGMLNDSEKLEVLQAANVFVLPSPSEGLSIALLEALFFNLPVITTTGVGLHKLIKKYNAGLIIDYDQKQLSEAIIALSKDSQIAMMNDKGQELIKSGYTWDKIANQFLKQINLILGN